MSQKVGFEPALQLDGEKGVGQRGGSAARAHFRGRMQRDGLDLPAKKAAAMRLALFCGKGPERGHPLCHNFNWNRPFGV